MSEFKLEGLQEFQEKLKLIGKKAPDRILDKLDESGKKLRKKVRENTPKGKTGNLRKGVRLLPVNRIQGGWEKGLTNDSPHYHLVERGHMQTNRYGEETGEFVHGKFYLEKTVKAMAPELNADLKKWLDELYKELSG